MTRLWQTVSIAALGVAAYQWLELFKWFAGEFAFAQTTGRHRLMFVTNPDLVTKYLVVVVVLSLASVLAARRLRIPSPSFARCGRFATYLLLGTALSWMALVVSPFVDLAFPYAG